MEFGFELQTEGASTLDITTIGFDLAKTVFQVHGADGEGRPVLRRKLRRGKVLTFFAGLPSCLVDMEACASAHYWARELQALGHDAGGVAGAQGNLRALNRSAPIWQYGATLRLPISSQLVHPALASQ